MELRLQLVNAPIIIVQQQAVLVVSSMTGRAADRGGDIAFGCWILAGRKEVEYLGIVG